MITLNISDLHHINRTSKMLPTAVQDVFLAMVKQRLRQYRFPSTAQVDDAVSAVLSELKPAGGIRKQLAE
jgi:hypothetical protein